MRGGHVVMFRHSITDTGSGEPPQYRFGDCATQRPLNGAGRDKAKRIGEAFARRGVRIDRVLSSAWCRSRDTAQLAFGRHEVWNPLNVQNLAFNPETNVEKQNAEVTNIIATWSGNGNLVLSTHQLNISNLVQIFPAEGDGVVLSYDGVAKRLIVVGPLRIQ